MLLFVRMKKMKKLLLLTGIAAASLLAARNMPQANIMPGINTETKLWAAVANADKSIKYSAVYDQKNLYILSEIAQKTSVYAGNGRGFANYNDGVEIRINRGKKHGYLQLWIDAANQVYLAEKYRPVSRKGILTASQILPGKGYKIFAAIPWKKVSPDTGKPVNVRVALIRIKVKKAFKYERETIVDTLVPERKRINFTVKNPVQINYNNFPVMNFGRSGYSSKDLLGQLPVILDHDPRLVILLIGTNDVVYKKKWQTPEQFAGHYRKICTRLLQQKCKVILITLPPCVENVANRHIKASPAEKTQLNPRIKAMNKYIKDFGKEFGFPVFDYHSCFTGNLEGEKSLMRVPANGGGYDGIHPTGQGYKLLASGLKKIIDEQRYPVSGIICTGDSITYGAHMAGQGSVIGQTYPAELMLLLNKNK